MPKPFWACICIDNFNHFTNLKVGGLFFRQFPLTKIYLNAEIEQAGLGCIK
ncbi:MAG: hypothetical protein CM1200mP29_10800 [Verrucomicrobiota bacterium]|nr:MAG: hypothetical protein CM1200mP29_10800 [Verrucomicrobiota bacterium]